MNSGIEKVIPLFFPLEVLPGTFLIVPQRENDSKTTMRVLLCRTHCKVRARVEDTPTHSVFWPERKCSTVQNPGPGPSEVYPNRVLNNRLGT